MYNQELTLAKIQQKKYRKNARLSKQKDLGNYRTSYQCIIKGKKGKKLCMPPISGKLFELAY
jgi:hypothetical protein